MLVGSVRFPASEAWARAGTASPSQHLLFQHRLVLWQARCAMEGAAVVPGGEGTVQAGVCARDARTGALGGASIGGSSTAVGVGGCSPASAEHGGAAGGVSAPGGDAAHGGTGEGASAPRTNPESGAGEVRGGEALLQGGGTPPESGTHPPGVGG